MNILILGSERDAHAAHMKAALKQKGCQVECFETTQFPSQAHFTWQPDVDQGRLTLANGVSWKFSDIHSVYWRSFAGVDVPPMEDSYQSTIALRDATSSIRTFLQMPGIHWVNSWKAYEFHKEKPLQLRRASQLGVKIPKTLITNDIQEILDFARSEEKLIFKPVYGGEHTKALTTEYLEPERLQSLLRSSAITIQEYIPGSNIRTFVVGDAIYAAKICTEALDFRDDLQAELLSAEIPEAIKQQCKAIAKSFWLEWTAIDWRLKPNGEYVFLEANPSPMFLRFEQELNFKITKSLATLLLKRSFC